MKNPSRLLTFVVVALLTTSGAVGQSKMTKLKNSLHSKVETLASDEVDELSESNLDRLSRNLDRALERLSKNSEHMKHVTEEWKDGDSDWAHVEECKVCNRNARNIFRGTGLEWMVPDLLEPELTRQTASAGYAPGWGVLICGCHGYVQIGTRRPNSACASGFDVITACAGWCPAGGSPWGARCG